jgi:hypothetical protein
VNSSVPLLGVASVWRISENAVKAKFAESDEAEVGLVRRGTMTQAIGRLEEAKDLGFLEEAPARPSG